MTICRASSGVVRATTLLVALLGVVSARAMGDDKPMSRYVPAKGLVAYFEFDGLDAQREAWEKTAAHAVLSETKTGKMLRSIVSQLMAEAADGGDKGPTPQESEAMIRHVVRHGAVIGLRMPEGDPEARRRGEPLGVFVARGAGAGQAGETFQGYLRRMAERDTRFGQQDGPGGRKVTVVGTSWGYWVEGEDLVIVFGETKRAAEGVIGTLDGDLDNASSLKFEIPGAPEGFKSVARAMIDIKAIGPLPPQASEAGLDGLEKVVMQWGFEGEAILSLAQVVAPAPRKGVLSVIDQPTFSPDKMIGLPAGLTDFAVVSVDWSKVIDALSGVPEVRKGVDQALGQFWEMTGMDLKRDVLETVGPQWAFYVQPPPAGAPAAALGGMATWFLSPPKLTAVVQVRDKAKFASSLDKLMGLANDEIVRSTPRDQPRVRIEERKEGDGYVLDVPPAVAPLPAGVRPALVIGEDVAAVAISPESAEAAVKAGHEGLGDEYARYGKNLVSLQQTDPRNTLPELIANIPFFLGLMAQSARDKNSPPFMKALARLRIDGDDVPDPESIRKHLFPNVTAVSVTDAGLTVVSRESVPGISASPATGGVMIGLLLPAVQSAREAARRAQCTNNLKQVALAMHNYLSAYNQFPGQAIRDSDGKPLLSWRVAILPFIEQQPLYEQFHLDEPWDSPHNKTLIDKMPAVYACPSTPTPPASGMTHYQVFNGPGSIFEEAKPQIQSILDGTSNTLLTVEAKEAVVWTKPDDVEFEEGQNPLEACGSPHPGGFVSGFADGSVRFLKTTINAAVFKALVSRNGGEVISSDSF